MKNLLILGSTGSIGNTTLKIVKKNKKKFNIKLLTTNKNINKIYKQALDFKVNKIVIHDEKEYIKSLNKFKKKKYSCLQHCR